MKRTKLTPKQLELQRKRLAEVAPPQLDVVVGAGGHDIGRICATRVC